jgi:hypothetical protein
VKSPQIQNGSQPIIEGIIFSKTINILKAASDSSSEVPDHLAFKILVHEAAC